MTDTSLGPHGTTGTVVCGAVGLALTPGLALGLLPMLDHGLEAELSEPVPDVPAAPALPLLVELPPETPPAAGASEVAPAPPAPLLLRAAPAPAPPPAPAPAPPPPPPHASGAISSTTAGANDKTGVIVLM